MAPRWETHLIHGYADVDGERVVAAAFLIDDDSPAPPELWFMGKWAQWWPLEERSRESNGHSFNDQTSIFVDS